jgi:DNA polymerase-3 subunit delta'
MTRQASYKIVLIQRLERMTNEAANSFLKMLEEPPPRTIFIMSCNNVKALLPTVVSRVRIIKFGVVSSKYLANKLRSLYPDQEDEIINQVSVFSLGRTGKAIQLMENPDVLADYIKTYHDVQNFLVSKNIHDRFSYVEGILEDVPKTDMFLNILKNVLRTKVLEAEERAHKHINTLLKISETATLLKKNVNARLALENLMLNL